MDFNAYTKGTVYQLRHGFGRWLTAHGKAGQTFDEAEWARLFHEFKKTLPRLLDTMTGEVVTYVESFKEDGTNYDVVDAPDGERYAAESATFAQVRRR